MRRRQAKKHPLIPDPRFNDTDVTYFVNNLMLQGKKSTAFDIFYTAIDKVTERTGEDGLEQWKTAVEAVTPMWRYAAAVLVVRLSRFHSPSVTAASAAWP